ARVVNVEIAMCRRYDIVAGLLATAHEVDAELPARTGNQHPHLEAGPGLQRLPPGAGVSVPLDGGSQTIDEVVLRLPTKRADLVVRDRVATIVAKTIFDRHDEALVAPG